MARPAALHKGVNRLGRDVLPCGPARENAYLGNGEPTALCDLLVGKSFLAFALSLPGGEAGEAWGVTV